MNNNQNYQNMYQQPQQPQFQQQIPMKPCKHCKQMIPVNANSCPFCNKKQKSSGCLIAIIIGIILSLVIGGLFFFIVIFAVVSNDKSEYDSMSDSDFKAICTSDYTYTEVARTPDDYKGKNLIVKGEIIQVQESGSRVIMRVAEKSYDDIWYVTYKYSDNESRLLEDDYITIYGTCDGLETYTSLLGQSISIPSIKAKVIEVSEEDN